MLARCVVPVAAAVYRNASDWPATSEAGLVCALVRPSTTGFVEVAGPGGGLAVCAGGGVGGGRGVGVGVVVGAGRGVGVGGGPVAGIGGRDAGGLCQPAPVGHVVGRAVRVVAALVSVGPPPASTSRNSMVPVPVGPST